MNNTVEPVRFGELIYAKITGQQLGVIVTEGDSWWWIRWDMEQKRRQPLTEFLGARTAMNVRVLDEKSVGVQRGGTEHFTLTADAEGNLLKDGQPWKDRGYAVYGDSVETIHAGPILKNKITRRDLSKSWPNEVRQYKPKTLEGSLGPDAKRVWPPKPGDKPGAPFAPTQQDGTASKPDPSVPVAAISNASEPSSLPGGWALWAGIAAVLATAAGWLWLRSKGKGKGEKF
jgi:hypothetical protein